MLKQCKHNWLGESKKCSNFFEVDLWFKKFKKMFFYIPSSYAKILGETKFQLRKFPRSGSKAIDVERDREREKEKVSDNNGQLRIANATLGGAHKPPGPIIFVSLVLE